MKISVIIPVYNVEKYLEKCLLSVKNQTYKDLEVIVVNDGTKDNSQKIIDKFCKVDSRFKSYIKENGGLADTRNYGTKEATGDYIVYLDSDDFWDLDLLETIVENIENTNSEPDLVYFPKRWIDEKEEILKEEKIKSIVGKSGEEVFEFFRNKHIAFETAVSFLIKKVFWDQMNFEFAKDRLHEDMGLIPIVLVQAETVNVIEKPFYNYLQRSGSITLDKNYEKLVKRANDVMFFYEEYQEKISELYLSRKCVKYLEDYIASAVIERIKYLKGNDFKEYFKKIKEYGIYKKINVKSIRSLIKKLYYGYLIYRPN